MVRHVVLCGLLWLLASSGLAQTTPVLRSRAGQDAVRAAKSADAFAAGHDVRASFQVKILQAVAGKRGEAWLEFSLESAEAPKDRVLVRVPISSTEDAYGESRACKVGKDGRRELTFTAGLDEPNFVEFRAGKDAHDISFLLNKYLCRVLASPFHCAGDEVALPKSWSTWKMAQRAAVRLSSDAPAAMQVSPVFLTEGERAFDYARCAVEARLAGCVA